MFALVDLSRLNVACLNDGLHGSKVRLAPGFSGGRSCADDNAEEGHDVLQG
jgi:hypothetical protein